MKKKRKDEISDSVNRISAEYKNIIDGRNLLLRMLSNKKSRCQIVLEISGYLNGTLEKIRIPLPLDYSSLIQPIVEDRIAFLKKEWNRLNQKTERSEKCFKRFSV